MADKQKTLKTYIVQKTYTYEVIVKAYDRDDAIARTNTLEPDFNELTPTIKCGTPKQLKRDDVA